MTNEEKLALEAEAKAKAEAEKNNPDGLSDEEKAKKDELSKKNTGVEEALKIEREKRIEAEKKLAETRAKAKERFEERKKKELSGEPDDEPITHESVRQLMDEERENLRKEMRQERAKEIAKELSEDESEAELVMEVWKNRTLSGTVEEQLREAHAIATYQKSQAQLRETKRALASKNNVSKDGTNAQRKPAFPGEPKLNELDKQVIAGMEWDNALKAYKKKIAGGKKMFYVSVKENGEMKSWSENV